jgi:hypothetical protein
MIEFVEQYGVCHGRWFYSLAPIANAQTKHDSILQKLRIHNRSTITREVCKVLPLAVTSHIANFIGRDVNVNMVVIEKKKQRKIKNQSVM